MSHVKADEREPTERRLQPAIHFAPVADANDHDYHDVVLDLVDDPVVAHTHAVERSRSLAR